MDRRLVLSNGEVAASGLKGEVDAKRFVDGYPRQINVPVADLLRDATKGGRERQLLYGDHFHVLEERGGFAFGQSVKDGYVGYVSAAQLTETAKATHIVSTLGTHLYDHPDIKLSVSSYLSFGSRLRIVSAENDFFETHLGFFVPKSHVRPANAPFNDPASVAQLFFGTPYLWGGNSTLGIDCSGLVQTALLACGYDCPGDADLQEMNVGFLLNDDTARRGDLYFWKAHVAMAVDEQTLIHSTANSMAVVYEPIEAVIERISAQGYGEVTSRKRL